MKLDHLISSDSPLESQVFPDTMSKGLFQEWLMMNDHITLHFESRGEFIARKWELLIKKPDTPTTIKKLWEYNLYLPEDLRFWELIQLIDTFRTTLKLDDTVLGKDGEDHIMRPFIDFLREQVIHLRKAGFWATDIRELKEEYSISDALVQELENITLSEAKKYIRTYATRVDRALWSRWEDAKASSTQNTSWKKHRDLTEDDILSLLSSGTRDLKWQLSTAVFHRGRQLVRYGLKNITEEWRKSLREKLKNEGWQNRWEWSWTKENWGKREQSIVFYTWDASLEQTEQDFRQLIRLDEYRERFATARKEKNPQKISELELEFSNLLIQKLHDFPYQVTIENMGYYPRWVVDHREIYCIGYSLVWHAYLSELGIEHSGLIIPGHSALSVSIWWQEYYFDATGWDQLVPLHWDKENTNWTMREFQVEWLLDRANQWDPEAILQCSMYHTRWIAYAKKQEHDAAIADSSESIRIDPKNADTYIVRWIALSNIWKHKTSLLSYAIAEKFWKENLTESEKKSLTQYANEILQIDEFISRRDYEWLRVWFEDVIKNDW